MDEFRKNENKWKWFQQANIIYSQIDKEYTFYPEIKDTIQDLETEKIIYIDTEKELNKYNPIHRTIPVNITNELKEELIFQKYIKEQKEKNNTNSIFTEMSIYNNNINSNSIFKVEQEKWLKKVKIIYNDFEKIKNKRINLKNIFKITIDQKVSPKWTKTQKKWIINGKIPLKSLFSTNLNTITRIEDFKTKFLMNIELKKKIGNGLNKQT